MELVPLFRLQFGLTILFHYLFPPLIRTKIFALNFGEPSRTLRRRSASKRPSWCRARTP